MKNERGRVWATLEENYLSSLNRYITRPVRAWGGLEILLGRSILLENITPSQSLPHLTYPVCSDVLLEEALCCGDDRLDDRRGRTALRVSGSTGHRLELEGRVGEVYGGGPAVAVSGGRRGGGASCAMNRCCILCMITHCPPKAHGIWLQ